LLRERTGAAECPKLRRRLVCEKFFIRVRWRGVSFAVRADIIGAPRSRDWNADSIKNGY